MSSIRFHAGRAGRVQRACVVAFLAALPSATSAEVTTDTLKALFTGSPPALNSEDRVRETFNVKDFGARGDGVSRTLASLYGSGYATYYPRATSGAEEVDTAAAKEAVYQACLRAAPPSSPELAVAASVVYPAGTYRHNATVAVTCGRLAIRGSGSASTVISRAGDYGPTFAYTASGAAQPFGLVDVGLEGFLIQDPGSDMTLATSPFHIVFDGISRGRVSDIKIVDGTGIIRFAGVNHFTINEVFGNWRSGLPDQIVGTTKHHKTGIFGDVSSNISLLARGNADVFIRGVNLKAFDNASRFFLSYGLLMRAADGLWGTDIHVEGTNIANYAFTRDSSYLLSNVYFDNIMSDICNGAGILVNGSSSTGYGVQRGHFNGWISASNLGAAGQHGLWVTPTSDGVQDFTFDVGVEGFKGDGIRIEAPKTNGVQIRVKQIRNLGGAGRNSTGINLLAGTGIAIEGGTIGNDAFTLTTGVRIGCYSASVCVDRVSMTGTRIRGVLDSGYVVGSGQPSPAKIVSNVSISGGATEGNTMYGGRVLPGIDFLSVVGMSHLGNSSKGTAGLQNSSGCSATAAPYCLFSSNLGL